VLFLIPELFFDNVISELALMVMENSPSFQMLAPKHVLSASGFCGLEKTSAEMEEN
jgi:hypothetical protein